MKRETSVYVAALIPGLILLLVFSSCTGAPSASDGGPGEGSPEERARAVLEEWETAVIEQDIESFMSLYAEDAKQIDCRFNGVLDVREGKAEIREFMSGIFEEHGEYLSEYRYPPADYVYDEVTGTPQMVLDHGMMQTELLRFEERDGGLKIVEIFNYRGFFEGSGEEGGEDEGFGGEGPEVGELTAWADEEGNGDGRLQREEQERLFHAAERVMTEPHDEENYLDEFFSWNDDGYVDELENEIALTVLVRNRFRRIDLFFPELARHRLPPADEERVGYHQANWVNGAAFGEEWAVSTGEVENEEQRLVDFNGDGLISPYELKVYSDIIIRTAAVNPAPVRYDKHMPAFIEDIRRWADQDRNGELDSGEINDAGFELFETVNTNYGNPAWTPVSRFFDRNRDAFLEQVEKEWALDFAVDFLLRTATEEGVPVWDREEDRKVPYIFDSDGRPELSEGELEKARYFITSFEEEFRQGEKPNATEHRWIDSNGDGTVEMWEADLARDLMFSAMFTAWLEMPGEEANSLRVRSALDEAADRDGDGMLSPDERERLIEAVRLPPHGAETAFEREIDFDGSGDLSRDEIMHARDTGYIPAGDAAAERRIVSLDPQRRDGSGGTGGAVAGGSAARGRTGAAAAKKQTKVKAVSSWGSSLAVLGVRDMTEKMPAGRTDLLISFLENAFVNYGNVTVVDRQNLEKIMEEYKYQRSALIDEETAVEIGKLSGADAIAIGNLSRLGETYYLHLKVINVKSGAIIGSSISEGDSEQDFLGMCNGAVEPLF